MWGPFYRVLRHLKVHLVQHDILWHAWGLCTSYYNVETLRRYLGPTYLLFGGKFM